jgi:hypothetical protein
MTRGTPLVTRRCDVPAVRKDLLALVCGGDLAAFHRAQLALWWRFDRAGRIDSLAFPAVGAERPHRKGRPCTTMTI